MDGSKLTWGLRLWFAVEVVFASCAIATVSWDPSSTGARFSWTIKPEVTAAMIGGFYLAIAPMMVLAVFARSWETVRLVVLPAAVFTGMLCVATWLHWDKFLHGTKGFYLWYASYLLPPPIFAGLYILQTRRARPVPAREPMGRAMRLSLVCLGALITADGVYGFVRPAYVVNDQAYAITALTARVLAGWIVAVGLILVCAGVEGAYERARIASPFLILPLPMIGLQMARYADQVDWTHPRLLVTAAVLALVSLLGLRLARGDWRGLFVGGQASRAAQPG